MTNNNRVLTITKLSLVDGIRVKNEVSNDLACRPHTPQKVHVLCSPIVCVYVRACTCACAYVCYVKVMYVCVRV